MRVRPSASRHRLVTVWLGLMAIGLAGCEGEVAALLSLLGGGALGAWLVARDRQNRALYDAERMRHALASGEPREMEMSLRRQLALAAAGEAVSAERQWLTRAQLGGLLVAEWRLDEARQIYGAPLSGRAGEREAASTRALAVRSPLSGPLADLALFGEHELGVLTTTPDENRLEAIRRDRDQSVQRAPSRYRQIIANAWRALEGLCLQRMGRSAEAVPSLQTGLESLAYNPARVVYLFHLGQALEQTGQQQLATASYAEAARAFPGTRLANEADIRSRALESGGTGGGLFRGMLPESPIGEAPVAGNPDEDA